MQTLNEDIKTGQFKRVYLLFGEEAFLKQSYKRKLKEAITGGETMNYHYFQGKGLDVKELISLGNTMPFFGEKRLILVEDSGFFKAAADELAAWLPAMPETTCLLFVEEAADKRSKLYKRVKELGYAAEMKRQDSAHLSRWAASILARNGRKVTSATMNLFLERTGDDMEQIWMELEKLISYTMGSDVVTPEDVEAVTSVQVSNRIFEMVSAMVAGKTKQAMGLFQDLLSLKEPPMRILFLIARQFNQLLQVKELTAQKKGRSEIAARLKVPPFVAGKLSAQAGAFSAEELLGLVNECVEAEEAVKTGRMDGRLAVELLLAGRALPAQQERSSGSSAVF
ncbi:DNA polymerase III subunit delta [Clostridiaceae bacterium]|nr:DNA polymerase III subunit delta [Clostridiaceae bacterium]